MQEWAGVKGATKGRSCGNRALRESHLENARQEKQAVVNSTQSEEGERKG